MAKHVNFGQIIVRKNPRDSLLLHTSRVSVVFFIPEGSAVQTDSFNLPSGYQTAAVTCSLNLFFQPTFKELNSNLTAISDPKTGNANSVILSKTHLYLHLQQNSFYSYGLPAVSRADDHEPRFVSIPIGSKRPTARIRKALSAFGPATLLISTTHAPLRLPPSVDSKNLLRKHEVERKMTVFRVPGKKILRAEAILSGHGEEETLDLIDQVQELVYECDAKGQSENTHSFDCAPKVTEGVQVFVNTYKGFCSSQLASECLQATRKTVQQLCNTNHNGIWAAILAVPPPSPLTWRTSLSPKAFSQNKPSPFQSGAAELFIITREHCVGAQMRAS